MTYTSITDEKPWQPRLPADPQFVVRTRAILSQARFEAQTLIDENRIVVTPAVLSMLEIKAKPKKRRYEQPKGPRPLTGNCHSCGFPKAEHTKGCESCYQRHRHLTQRHGIPRPPVIDRTKGVVISRTLTQYSEKERKRKAGLCQGCEIPWDQFTPGCMNCEARKAQRDKAISRQQRTFTAEDLPPRPVLSSHTRISRFLRGTIHP